MAMILKYKISTTIGTVLLMTIMILCIVTITNRAFSDGFNMVESSERSQLDLIKGATDLDMDKNNIANWNVYINTKYGFNIKYPETLAQMKDENKKIYAEDYSGIPIRPLKISFENFSIKVWNNSGDQELKKYLASEEVCALEGALCSSYKKIDEIALANTTISGKEWYQTKNKPLRFFISSPDNKYIFDFESINPKQDKEFNKIISTLRFVR